MACFLSQDLKKKIWRPRGYVFFPLKECVMLASLSETIKKVGSIFGINKSAVYYPHTGSGVHSKKNHVCVLIVLFHAGCIKVDTTGKNYTLLILLGLIVVK